MSEMKSLKTLLQEDLEELKTLRDEARLNLHLAGMDGKDSFRELEAKLDDLEKRLMPDGRATAVNAALRLGHRLRRSFRDYQHPMT